MAKIAGGRKSGNQEQAALDPKNRGVLITGGALGIGAEMVRVLARQGYRVSFTYRKSKKAAGDLVREVKDFGGDVSAFRCDVTDPVQIRDLIAVLTQTNRPVDILINNVGDYLKKSLEKVTVGEWDAIIASNLHATFYGCHSVLPSMVKRRYGRIINIGFASCGQVVAKPLITPYFVAKQGALLLTKSIAVTYARYGITCNMISPGVMENSRSKPTRKIPIGRWGKLRELAAAALFLLAEDADYISGAHLEISGGWNV
ncbi:MAG: SDR family oxidoreductase [Nitrospirae bacterium]|nr:SDR family oxidoreductase [Nitrospirota bacterium]